MEGIIIKLADRNQIPFGAKIPLASMPKAAPTITRRPSSNGSSKRGTASPRGAGESLPRRLARFAPFGPRSEPQLPTAKACPVSGSGSKRKVASSSPCKASAPTSLASGGRSLPNQSRRTLRPSKPLRRPCHAFRAYCRSLPRTRRGSPRSSIHPARRTKAS